ncbi:unnamed protein product [Rhodiola kirilowii]
MAKDGELGKVKGMKKERRERAKKAGVEVVDSNVVAEIDGKKKRKKREKEKGVTEAAGNSVSIDPVVSVDKVKRKNKDERKKKRKGKDVVEAVGQATTDDESVICVIGGDASNSSHRNKKKKKNHNHTSSDRGQQLKSEGGEAIEDDVLYMSSGDEDALTGMKKWLTEYHEQRPGFEVLQRRIDEFIIAHEQKLEQERKEREARIAEDGWTVVEHHKGRKKTTDAESGIVVGSVAQAAVQDKLAKKKQKGVGPDFYRFQRREAQRNQVIMLQSKFEEDKKRIQQLRAARKFRPY